MIRGTLQLISKLEEPNFERKEIELIGEGETRCEKGRF